MEGSTAMVLAILVLAAGGAAGAVMMADGSLIGGSDGDDVAGLSQVEPLPYGDVDGSCSLGRAEGDCASGDCSVPDEDDQDSGGCCC